MTLLDRNCRTLIGLVVNKLRFVVEKRTCISYAVPTPLFYLREGGIRFLCAIEPEH